MLPLIVLLPWVLTMAALFIIIAWKRKSEEEPFNDFLEQYEDAETIRVAVYDDRAYWVYENVFYESDIVREPDFTTARPIDIMNLPTKDLNKLLSILDEIEESNERD